MKKNLTISNKYDYIIILVKAVHEYLTSYVTFRQHFQDYDDKLIIDWSKRVHDKRCTIYVRVEMWTVCGAKKLVTFVPYNVRY